MIDHRSASPEMSGFRVPPLPESEWLDVHRTTLDGLGVDGPVDSFLGSLLHAPEIVEAVVPMTRYVDEQSTLEPSHRLLLALRTAWLDQSETLWTSYADRGAVEHPEVVQLALGLATPDDVAGSLLQFADELVLTSSVTDSTWARLARGHDVHWLMDAVETVAHQALLCCLANSFGGPTTVMPKSPDRPSSLEREPPLRSPGSSQWTAPISPCSGPSLVIPSWRQPDALGRHSSIRCPRSLPTIGRR